MPTRRAVLLGGAGVAGGLAVGGGLAVAKAARPDPGALQTDEQPLYTFASMPDFFNVDVGDVSTLPTWDGGENSLNPSWQAAIDHCLGVVMAHEPQAI